MRLNDEITNKLKVVDSVAKYIENLQLLQKEWCCGNQFMVYRGEPREYTTPCIPTIYRGFILKQSPNYEINMFMAMRQNNISQSEDYLHNAIDAQHDGFPSRLLDVSYNSLSALYFAVTPYYHHDESDTDNEDGMVYVFRYEKAYSPEAKNTKDIYVEALKGGGEVLNSPFLSYNHPLIDHCKQNKRIVAQQGAFILFRGEKPIPIPYHMMCGIRIARTAKKRIRHELKTMFGIYTGSIYPEVELMEEEVKQRCMRFNAYSENISSSTEAALDVLKDEYEYFVDCFDYYIEKKKPTGELVRLIEKTIVANKKYLKEYWTSLTKLPEETSNSTEVRDRLVERYNEIIESFANDLPATIRDTLDPEVCGKIREGEKNDEN